MHKAIFLDRDGTINEDAGDHSSDIEMAHKGGAGSVYLLTGHGKKHRHELLAEPNFIANGIYEASMWITRISTR